MNIGGRDVPTPLIVGGIAGVGILVLGQRLTGQAAPAAEPAAVAGAGGGTGTSDLWGDAEVGQFPSFIPAVPDAGSSPGGDFGWWDSEAPPAAPPPINAGTPPPSTTTPTPTPITPGATPVPITTTPTPTPTPTPAPVWYPAGLSAPPSNATGAIKVAAGTYRWYTVSSGKITGFKTVAVGAFVAYTDRRAMYPWPAENSQRILARIISGSHAGNYFSTGQAGVTYYDRP